MLEPESGLAGRKWEEEHDNGRVGATKENIIQEMRRRAGWKEAYIRPIRGYGKGMTGLARRCSHRRCGRLFNKSRRRDFERKIAYECATYTSWSTQHWREKEDGRNVHL